MNIFTVDRICSARNEAILGTLCSELRARNLEELLSSCNRRFTIFAPDNDAFERFFIRFDNDFFGDPNNNFFDVGNDNFIVGGQRKLQDANSDRMVRRNRNLQMQMMTAAPTQKPTLSPANQSRRGRVLRTILRYHIARNVYRRQDLECNKQIVMLVKGTTTTRCRNKNLYKQRGTCEVVNLDSEFSETMFASNGVIHVISNVMIPSPDGTAEGCNKFDPSETPSQAPN